MMSSGELRYILDEVLVKNGFNKQGAAWVRRSKELSWVVELDRSPYKERYSLEIGASIQSVREAQARHANDCPFLIHLDDLPLRAPKQVQGTRLGDFSTAVSAGFDLTFDMSDEERRSLLGEAFNEAAAYICGINSVEQLRSRYKAGHFDSAFIRKDVRSVLEAGPSATCGAGT